MPSKLSKRLAKVEFSVACEAVESFRPRVSVLFVLEEMVH